MTDARPTHGARRTTLDASPVRAILKITPRCNAKCLFCRVADGRDLPDPPADAVARKVVAARGLGVGMVLFSGGEPTLRDDLPALARVATAAGLTWGLITNGRRLAYRPYRERLLALGLAYVHTSLHGATAATHDAATQCGGFDQVLAALDGLAAAGVELHVNTVVSRVNAGELPAISALLAPRAPLTHKLCLMEPRGLFDANADRLLVPPEAAGRAAVEAVLRARADHAGRGLATVVEGFPSCQVAGALDAVSGLHAHNIRYMSEVDEDRLYPTDHGERAYPEPCDACAARAACPGVYVGYVARYGAAGLVPFAP